MYEVRDYKDLKYINNSLKDAPINYVEINKVDSKNGEIYINDEKEARSLYGFLIAYFTAKTMYLMNPNKLAKIDYLMLYTLLNPIGTLNMLEPAYKQAIEESGVPEVIIGDMILTKELGVWELKKFTNTAKETVYLPSFVTHIGKEAFKDNKRVKHVISFASNLSIGEKAFYDAKNLQTLTCEKGVKAVGAEAFANCGNLSEVRFAK